MNRCSTAHPPSGDARQPASLVNDRRPLSANAILATCALWSLGFITSAHAQEAAEEAASATTQEEAQATVEIQLPVQTRNVQVPMALARLLPPTSLRGEFKLVHPQQALVNGKVETVAPGLRIRNASNMLVTTGLVLGQKFTVNYLRDGMGLIQQIWILRDDERARLWPKTAAEAAKWVYDPYTQTWKK